MAGRRATKFIQRQMEGLGGSEETDRVSSDLVGSRHVKKERWIKLMGGLDQLEGGLLIGSIQSKEAQTRIMHLHVVPDVAEHGAHNEHAHFTDNDEQQAHGDTLGPVLGSGKLGQEHRGGGGESAGGEAE